MSQPWDPPDPEERIASRPARANRSVGVVLLILTALVAGGAVSYVVSQAQEARTSPSTFPATIATTSSTTSTSTSTTLATTTLPTTTSTSTTTIVPVVGDHMVFADGYPLGQVTPDGFVAYQGDAASQLRQGPIEVSSIVNFVGAQFSAQVRPLDPSEMSETCPIAVQPRAADNATPLGLWVEAPNWQLQPATATPVPVDDPAFVAVVQLVAANGGVQPAPPPQRGSAVLVDLVGDGVPDLLVSATYSDDTTGIYYRTVAVAPDDNPAAATAVMLEFGVTHSPDGSRDPLSRGELRVDGVAELTGRPPYELVIRRTTATTTGVTIRDLAGTELASYACPR